jgi:group I intron endonuclease
MESSNLPTPTFSIPTPLPELNSLTGKPFTAQESRELLLASLVPVTPWFPIKIVGEQATSCRAPNYIKHVGNRSLIYVYRLISNKSVCYIGSAENGTTRFRTHREHCSAFLRGVSSSTAGSKGLYSAVKKHGWQSFEIAALAFCEKSELAKYENAWLALKPTLNRSYYAEGVVKLSPETIASMSASMSGSNNPFYGKTHSPEKRREFMLSREDRIEVHQYTPEFLYTGNSYESINQAVRDGNAHLAGVQRVLKSGGTSRGYRYSTAKPVKDKETGKMVLPINARIQDPFRGTGSHLSAPVKVTCKGSDTAQYFVSQRRAVDVIREGSLWPGHSVSRQSTQAASLKAINGVYTVKSFTFTAITREQFMEWFNSTATQEQILLSFKPWKVHK